LVVSRGTDGSNPASSSGESPANLSRSTSALNADKPSIAVLPFQNMSGDLEQEFFSDGISAPGNGLPVRRDREILWGGRRGNGNFVAASNRWSAAMPQPNDLSRSLVALDQNNTIIAVVELSQSS
jgi:hypothetical protein